jgi:hypothetical protein
MPQQIDEYRRMIKLFADRKIAIRIPNGRPEHASILMEAMFENATTEVRIFTRDLNEKIYGSAEMLKTVRSFIDRPNSCLKILFQNNQSLSLVEQHPLLKEINNITSRGLHGTIEIKNAVGSYATNEANHFAVMDSDAFRYETNHDGCKAVANFYEPKMAKKLIQAFDSAFSMAKESLFLVKASC